MESKVIKIEIISKIGTLTFTEYQELVNFEKNNWKILGETSYRVFRKFEDGDVVDILHSGINGSAHMACDVEGEEIDIPNVD